MNFNRDEDRSFHRSNDNLAEQVALEKISYMRDFANTSTVATIVAPLLCIPLYSSPELIFRFYVWLALMATAVMIRIMLIQSIRLDGPIASNFKKMNWAVAVVTFVWGIGWLVLLPNVDLVNYLIYQIISLTVLFVGMVGYCVNWKTFYSFALPLKVPELIFLIIHHEFVIWPIAIGSVVNFYLALRMGMLFSKSWEKSIALRFKNETLFNQLTIEKDASVAANVAKSEFIATASHDLRQPMQAINIFIELFDFERLAKKEKNIFQKMRSSIAVLNKMFNTLLDISKLDSNLQPSHTHFELTPIVTDLGLTFNLLAIEKGLTLEFHYDNFWVHGDSHLTEQILRNLLANAIQYTNTGRVVVSFFNESDQLSISVQDTGCGIPQEDMPFIYKEFFRSQNARSQHDGLGLGLSIVSRITQKIGGSLSVVSQTHVGSVFKVNTQFKILNIQPPASSPASSGADTQIKRTSKESVKHLGILENDKSLMFAYCSYFKRMGYEVHAIPHIESEFKEALLNIPKLDFILSDYRLGEQDGIYFIENLREEFNEKIPACIVTADTTPSHLNFFKELQVDVLYKPIDIFSIAEFIADRVH